MHRVFSVEGGDTKCTRSGATRLGASSFIWDGSLYKPRNGNRRLKPRWKKFRTMRPFFAWQIGLHSDPLLEGGENMYIQASLVNTCTSQAGPLRVKGNQLLPPSPGLHLPPLVRLRFLPLQEQATRRDTKWRCDEAMLDLTRPWSCFFWYPLLIRYGRNGVTVIITLEY